MRPEIAAWLESLEPRGIRLGLDRVERLLAAAGDPQRRFRSIHVAGTNGKGSVCAMIATGLRAAGVRAGLYTSPHLVRMHERIAVDLDPIGDDDLDAALAAARRACADTGEAATWFEAVTAAAFAHFARVGVPWAVVEVGLGGRLDATNVLAPTISVVTRLSTDHAAILGSTPEAIAGEKAGILKRGVPAVASPSPPEFLEPLRRAAAERGAPLVLSAERVGARPGAQGRTDFESPVRRYESVRLALRGAHQVENARTAIAALELLEESGLAIGEHAVRAALERVRWHGRLQTVALSPEVIVDGAHNPDGARALAESLLDTGPAPVLVFGAMEDKDVAAIAARLFPVARAAVLTSARTPRAAPASALAALAREHGIPHEETPGVAAAVARAREIAGPAGRVVVAGSLYVVGEALEALEADAGADGSRPD